MDRIFITALSVETVIGIHDWERELRQRIEIDLDLWFDVAKAAKSDAIEDTLNYKSVAKRVLAFATDSRFKLVEALAGAIAAHYSVVDDAISDLAAVDASTRVVMTVGFVVFGSGVVAFGLALREVLEGRAWIAAVVTGGCTIGVAATPLGGWSGDAVHASATAAIAAVLMMRLIRPSWTTTATGRHPFGACPVHRQ